MLSKRPVTWETGLLSPNTIYLSERGGMRIVAEYREPQMTGVWMDGSETAVRVPLPGLLLIRTVKGGQPDYRLFAVKERPADLKAQLFHAPLPNVYGNGGICWGSVARPVGDALESTTLAKDWNYLLGTRFSDHGVNGKSKTNRDDIRKKLIALEKRGVKRYPLSDLIEAGLKLESELRGRE